MRFHATAAACALATTFFLPSAAQAADGTFAYSFQSRQGPMTTVLTDPPSGQCLLLPEVMGPDADKSAYAPRNETDSVAVGFTGPRCAGDGFAMRPHGGPMPQRVKLRSVVFS
jgi:hypothetical protein